jgi:hypothetical protein
MQPTTEDSNGVPFVAIKIPLGCGFVILDGANKAVLTLTPGVDGMGNPIYEQS